MSRKAVSGTAGWIAVVLLAAACGSSSGATATTGAESTSPSITVVHRNVSFYGPCGNETLRVGGTTFFQLFQHEIQELDADAYPMPIEETSQGISARVPQPGKGDDVGTLVVYDDGNARFESKSGLVWWLTTEEHDYNWVC